MTKEEILAYLKSKQQFFYDNFGIKFIGLFGSFSRDEAKDSSDIDILYHIEENKKLSMFKYLKVIEILSFIYKIFLMNAKILGLLQKMYLMKSLLKI